MICSCFGCNVNICDRLGDGAHVRNMKFLHFLWIELSCENPARRGKRFLHVHLGYAVRHQTRGKKKPLRQICKKSRWFLYADFIPFTPSVSLALPHSYTHPKKRKMNSHMKFARQSAHGSKKKTRLHSFLLSHFFHLFTISFLKKWKFFFRFWWKKKKKSKRKRRTEGCVSEPRRVSEWKHKTPRWKGARGASERQNNQ